MKKAYMVYLLAPVNVRVVAESKEDAVKVALHAIEGVTEIGNDDGRSIYLDNESAWLLDGPGLKPSTDGGPVVSLGLRNPSLEHAHG